MLEEDSIRVIVVVIGNEVDCNEFGVIIFDKIYVINVIIDVLLLILKRK